MENRDFISICTPEYHTYYGLSCWTVVREQHQPTRHKRMKATQYIKTCDISLIILIAVSYTEWYHLLISPLCLIPMPLIDPTLTAYHILNADAIGPSVVACAF
jgi:hypothetical protein